MPTAAEDREQILRLHEQWWRSNIAMDIEQMRPVFAGDRFLQYNLTGHPYHSLDELTALWKAFQGVLTIPDISPAENLRLEIVGEAAWLACENVVRVQVPDEVDLGAIPRTPFRIRSTEIYQRDDGAGNASWRMWHHHCSPAAPEDEPRLPFGDTFAKRNGAIARG